MAGDWIKMRTDLFTHPKVVRISSALKADTLRTVGGLMSVWSLFDAHSIDGELEGYTFEAIDDHLRWSGFSAAMKSVLWLEETAQGLALPEFDTHNGASAKRRAQDADRKRESRKTSAPEADENRTREEKRREEKKERDTRATRIPEDWSVTAELGNWALEQNPEWSNEDVLRIGVKFKNHWLSKSGKDARKIDWKATWQNWILNEIDYAKKRQA